MFNDAIGDVVGVSDVQGTCVRVRVRCARKRVRGEREREIVVCVSVGVFGYVAARRRGGSGKEL